MKKLVLILCVAFNGSVMKAQSQSLPYIETPTVIPQSPASSDIVKIITKVITPNQGVIVDQGTFSVTQSPQEIKIRACYWNGMLPATQEFTDTLTIGQLPAGTYTIKHKAYLSSGQQVCHPTDSNLISTSFTVTGPVTGIIENNDMPTLYVFPNPAKDLLYLKNITGQLNVQIYSSNGSLIKNETLGLNSEINIRDLREGLYFIRFRNGDKNEIHKFVKVN